MEKHSLWATCPWAGPIVRKALGPNSPVPLERLSMHQFNSAFWLGCLYVLARTVSLSLVLLGAIQISMLLVAPPIGTAPNPPTGNFLEILGAFWHHNPMP